VADDQIDFIVADLATFSEERLVGLMLDLNANLIINTPIDIGWARAGWVPSIGQPYEGGDQRNVEPGMVPGAQATQQAGNAALLGYKLADGPMYSTNNVVYIGRLNAGHSPQAPPGFVPRVIELTIQFSEHGGSEGVTPRSSFVYRPGR
jgi:hypothetical protein